MVPALWFGVDIDQLSSVGLIGFIVLYSSCTAILCSVAIIVQVFSAVFGPFLRQGFGIAIRLSQQICAGLQKILGMCASLMPASIMKRITLGDRFYRIVYWTIVVMSFVTYIVAGHVILRPGLGMADDADGKMNDSDPKMVNVYRKNSSFEYFFSSGISFASVLFRENDCSFAGGCCHRTRHLYLCFGTLVVHSVESV